MEDNESIIKKQGLENLGYVNVSNSTKTDFFSRLEQGDFQFNSIPRIPCYSRALMNKMLKESGYLKQLERSRRLHGLIGTQCLKVRHMY